MWYPSVGWTTTIVRLNHYCGGSAYTRIPHHQQTIPLHNTNTPQVSLHNNAPSSRKLLKMDVLTSERCWAVNWHNKTSVIKLVYLYSNIKMVHGPVRIRSFLKPLVYLVAVFQLRVWITSMASFQTAVSRQLYRRLHHSASSSEITSHYNFSGAMRNVHPYYVASPLYE